MKLSAAESQPGINFGGLAEASAKSVARLAAVKAYLLAAAAMWRVAADYRQREVCKCLRCPAFA